MYVFLQLSSPITNHRIHLQKKSWISKQKYVELFEEFLIKDLPWMRMNGSLRPSHLQCFYKWKLKIIVPFGFIFSRRSTPSNLIYHVDKTMKMHVKYIKATFSSEKHIFIVLEYLKLKIFIFKVLILSREGFIFDTHIDTCTQLLRLRLLGTWMLRCAVFMQERKWSSPRWRLSR